MKAFDENLPHSTVASRNNKSHERQHPDQSQEVMQLGAFDLRVEGLPISDETQNTSHIGQQSRRNHRENSHPIAQICFLSAIHPHSQRHENEKKIEA